MATFGRYDSIPGLLASATLAASQYKIVKVASTAGEVIVGAAATDELLGIVQNDPAAGEPADVAFLGIGKALAEASVAYGDPLTCSTTGRVKSTTTNGHRVVGYALEASSTAGDIIRVILSPAYFRST
jgi:hypothetical protein